ncbi:MAG: hypothetical protein GY804_06545 [Alphaproteobacteria bacterium]|nr:hypothetical protein [Alphaproteobacteria bacterium]
MRFCGSCGMPFNQDPENGGTNSDGSKSTDYCSLCYKDGEFQDKCKTAEEMQEFCMKVMMLKGTPKMLAWLATRNIPKYKRWKT